MSRPIFRRKSTALALGVAFFVGAWVCLYDAWEGRGGTTPAILRPVTWW